MHMYTYKTSQQSGGIAASFFVVFFVVVFPKTLPGAEEWAVRRQVSGEMSMDHDELRRLLCAALLADERLVDMWDDTASSDGGLDQAVQLLVSSDGEL